MGVDYSAHYGIGIGIQTIDFEDEDLKKEIKDLECIYEVLDELLDEKHSWFETGEGSYTGEENEFFVEILDPFKYGLDLSKVKQELMEHLKSIGLEVKGDFGLIGGLEIH